MIQAEKNRKRRSSYLPISIGWVLKIAFAVAGFALWGWGFAAVVAGFYIGFKFLKGVLSCLLSLLIMAVVVAVLVTIIFNIL
jgi:hypothetical protein